MERVRLVEVSSQEVRIDFSLNCKCRARVRMRSLVPSTPILFKVQTSSPHKFLVNPPCGLILPLSYATFQIILKPQSHLPPTFPRSPSDRFLIITALAPDFHHVSSESTHPDEIASWFSSRQNLIMTHDVKLKVAFVGPFLLSRAVRNGDVDAVKNLIKRQKSVVAELSPREAQSLLRAATELDYSGDVINLLVEAGLKIDDANVSNGGTELHVADAFDRTDEVTGLIKRLDCGDNCTPLHLAASEGHLGRARVLMDAGANVDTRELDGHGGAANGDRRIAVLLSQLGMDPTSFANDPGRSAAHAVTNKGHDVDIVEIPERGETVLNAARHGDTKRLESVLLKEGNINYRDQYGLTPLHVAAIKGHKNVVLLIVEHGCSDLNCLDNEGHSPLHLAVEGGSFDVVQILIDNGADVNAKSNRGATPLYIARAMGYDDISKFLLNSGAD